MKTEKTTQADFTYTESYPWVNLFPNNEQAENVWREFCQLNNTSKFSVLTVHKAGCFAALKKLGYTVKKAKKPTQLEIDAMYAEIDEAFNGLIK